MSREQTPKSRKKPPEVKACGKCAHYECTDPSDPRNPMSAAEFGECRIDAPIANERGYASWPRVRVDHWCAKWKRTKSR